MNVVGDNKSALFWFLTILSSFMLILNAVVVTQQRANMLDTAVQHVIHESNLLGSLLKEALLKGDYATVEFFTLDWANARQDIVAVTLTANTGFNIVDYKETIDAPNVYRNSIPISYGDGNTAILTIEKDFSNVYEKTRELIAEMTIASIAVIIILGAVLWRSILVNLIGPLQNEVNKRVLAERELTQQASQLVAARDRALEATQAKSSFLANMSHELRTPLNSIIGFTDIIKNGNAGPVNEEQKKQLGMVYSSARHLLGLINDVLDLSKVEAGKMEIEQEVFDVKVLTSEVVSLLQPQAVDKSLNLSYDVALDIGLVESDRAKLRQILLNLISNAVKFTHSGSIFIGCWRDDRRLLFSVKDTGKGISPEQQQKIFSAFHQVDSSDTRSEQGTGLGLSICIRFAELLNGKISINSSPEQGSEFLLSIPCTFLSSGIERKLNKRTPEDVLT